ncbi:MAG: tetraacyldisaccharide 4'-kinase [Nitrospirae bacterium]|nr:tetraacyldisaccharide 4'-kinase [Nitrospirota bacterium]
MKTETYTSSRQWFNKIINTTQPEGGWRVLFSFLYLVSLLYFFIVKSRTVLYSCKILKTYTLPKRVISVGNITVGGTGKTPTVLALARFFNENGKKVAILSRGYGRTNEGAILIVSDGNQIFSSPSSAGEEAYFLAKELKGVIVAVGKNRYKTGLNLLTKYKIDLFILDDGYQHLKLHRDTNILLLDSDHPFSNGSLLPRGGLREPLSSIKRASMIFLTSKNGNHNKAAAILKEELFAGIPKYNVHFAPKCFFNALTAETCPIKKLSGNTSLIFSGIANPRSFRAMVDTCHIQVVRELVFPDHHRYQPHDIDAIYDIARYRKVDFIITTDKDAVKLTPYLRKEVPLIILKLEFKTEADFPWETLKSEKGS